MQETEDVFLIPGSGRSPGGGHGNPVQYSCLENPMDRGAWEATVHGVSRVRQDRAQQSSSKHSPRANARLHGAKYVQKKMALPNRVCSVPRCQPLLFSQIDALEGCTDSPLCVCDLECFIDVYILDYSLPDFQWLST